MSAPAPRPLAAFEPKVVALVRELLVDAIPYDDQLDVAVEQFLTRLDAAVVNDLAATPAHPKPVIPALAGVDPRVVRDEVLAFIRKAITNRPRDLQKEIGPSGIGHPCDRSIGYLFADHPKVGFQRPPWRQSIGTAVDDHFKGWADAANESPWEDGLTAVTELTRDRLDHDDVVTRYLNGLDQADADGGRRWWTDLPTYPGDLYPDNPPGQRRPITGHLDLYDAATAGVIDVKGLAVDTPIPTPIGWSTMGDLAVGDQVLGADGRPAKVVEKSDVHLDRPCYRVTFNDGASVVTDNVHLWRFRIGRAERARDVIMSTEDAVGQVRNAADRGQRHLRVMNPEPLDLPAADLPVAPYVLGVWLGDGENSSGRITNATVDAELFDHVRAAGYDAVRNDYAPGSGTPRWRVVGLTAQLRAAGLIGHKAIPAAYLRGSLEQRLELLRGLMDTDGGWNRARNDAAFTTIDKALAHDVAELVRTLGWKVHLAETRTTGFGRPCTAYRVTFVPYGLNPFRLSRKADQVRTDGSRAARRRVVQSIESVPVQPTQCIVLDNPDRMFLCGAEMVPTHNCPGKTQMKLHKPGPRITHEQYRVQVHTYGAGLRRLGWRVDWVGVLRLPIPGELDEATFQWEPYDQAIVDAAFLRAGTIARMVDALGLAAMPMLPVVDHYCYRCDWYDPTSTDPTVACPGAPGHKKGFTPSSDRRDGGGADDFSDLI